ncbi:hypothetical protein [Pedobacter arcticus]|uniref:hypothetical protein n=1 Tax=Pedobacter arcticus TaxID=752140 RepID=UPI000312F5D7|nr:hypothetical protein [Pedobacter arcticus]
MFTYNRFKFLIFAVVTASLASCSTERLATQNADDVYFKDVEAIPATYASVPEKSYKEGNYSDRNGYDRNDDYYYDRYENTSRFDIDNWRNNYSWRDYYYMDRYSYDPFFGPSSYLGFNNFYGNGWGFSLGYNTPFYNYNMPFYNTSYFNYYGSFYGNSPYWGIYSYYNPGYYGNYYGGYYGGGYYGNPYYGSGYYGTTRTLKPRPSGSNDNMRGADRNSRIPMPNERVTRPSSSDNGRRTQSADRDGNYNPYGRPTRPTGTSTDQRTEGQRQPTSQPSSRPTRPTRDSGSDSRGGSSEPVSRPTSRPTRSETPSYTPSRSTESSGSSGSSSSGSSSSGRSSSGRPSR